MILVAAVALVAATSGLGQPGLPEGDVAFVDDVDNGAITQDELDSALDQAAAQGGLPKVPAADDPQYQALPRPGDAEPDPRHLGRGRGRRPRHHRHPGRHRRRARSGSRSRASPARRSSSKFVKQSKFTDEDVQEQVELTLLRDKLEQEVVTKPTISDDEIEKFYEVNIDSFKQPATRDVRVILNSSQAKAEQAKQALEADDSDASWKKVAKQYSQDQASKDRGGLLEGLTEGQGDPQLEEQAFSAAEGEIVGPFKTDRGYYVIEVTSDQPGDDAAARRGERRDRAAARLRQAAADRHRLPDRLHRQVDAADDLRAGRDDRALQQLRRRPRPSRSPASRRRRPSSPRSRSSPAPRRSRSTAPPQQGLPQGPQPPADDAAAAAAPGRRGPDRPRRRPDRSAAPPPAARAADRRAAAPPRHRRAVRRLPDAPMSSDSARAAAGAEAIARARRDHPPAAPRMPVGPGAGRALDRPAHGRGGLRARRRRRLRRRRQAARRARRRALPGPLPRPAARGARGRRPSPPSPRTRPRS